MATTDQDTLGRAVPSVTNTPVRVGLQARLTVLIIGMTFSVAWLASTYLVQSTTHMVRDDESADALRVASLLARALAPLVDAEDWAQLSRVVHDVTESSSLLGVSMVDVNFRPLGAPASASAVGNPDHAGRGSEGGAPPIGLPVYYPSNGERPAHLGVVYPIRTLGGASGDAFVPSRPRLLGYVRVEVPVQTSLDWAARTIDILTGVGIMIGLLAIPLCFVLARRMVTPLETVASAMNAFAGGDLRARSVVRRGDEIGAVATAFNRMADRHERTHEDLLRLNADLERRVSRRTYELRQLAARDPLTGLFNRRHLEDVLARRFSEAKRHGHDLSYVMIDLDNFKAINDDLGHPVGDTVLVLLASTITAQLRASDVAARFGGDEFVILLPQTDGTRARVLCERLAGEFAQRLCAREPRAGTSLSVGIADLRSSGVTDASQLVRVADRAMYRAKASGKHQIVTASEPADAATS